MSRRIWVKRHTRKDGVTVKGHHRLVGNHETHNPLKGTRFRVFKGRHFPTDAGPYSAEVDGIKGQASYSMASTTGRKGRKEEGEWQVWWRAEGVDPNKAVLNRKEMRGWLFGTGTKGKIKAKKFLDTIRV